MQTLALLATVIATVTASHPPGFVLDRGQVDGLRVGDVGSAHYVLEVGESSVRIEAGRLRVDACDHESSLALPLSRTRVYPGFLVEFQVPPERESPSELLGLASRYRAEGDPTAALLYLRKLQDRSPVDPAVARQVEEVLQQLERARAKPGPAAARGSSLDESDPAGPDAGSPRAAPEGGSKSPGEHDSGGDAGGTVSRAEAILIEGGIYSFGLPRDLARFHNQLPRFEMRLDSFRIDRQPIDRLEFERITGRAPETVEGDWVTGVTQQQAAEFCEALGLRLPSEFEWRAAADHPAFQRPPGLAEWTDSWYLPYPGNQFAEPEYGRRFKVVRGHDTKGEWSPEVRFFMAPQERARDVTWRCARDVAPAGSH